MAVQNKIFAKTNYILAMCLGLIIFFQNCSKTQFTQSSQMNTALFCDSVTTEKMDPTLLWDWKAKLKSSQSPDFDQVMSSPMVADLDGDSVPEVVFVSFASDNLRTNDMTAYYPAEVAVNIPSYQRNGILRIVDGRTGETKISVADHGFAPQASRSPLLIDLDNDGKIEVVYVHFGNSSVVALNHNGTLRWKFQLPQQLGLDIRGLNAFDVDRDGLPEIGVGPYILSEIRKLPSIKFQLAGRTSTLLGNQLGIPLDGVNQSIIDSETGVFEKNGALRFAFEESGNLGVGDLIPTISGLEVAVVKNGIIKIYSAAGKKLKTIDLNADQTLKCPGDGVGGGSMAIANFDGNDDGRMQMAIATGKYLSIIDSDGRILAKSETVDCSSMRTSLTIFDFNGDKQPEILYADQVYLRVFYFKGGRLIEGMKIVNPSATLVEYPVVADINGDLSSEILVASNNFGHKAVPDLYFYTDPADSAIGLATTGLRAYKARKGNWMPTRPIWNQFDYIPGNVNDRGQISTDLRSAGASIVRRNILFWNEQELACKRSQ